MTNTKQAIMVLGHGDNANVLQETIQILDNENIDIIFDVTDYAQDFFEVVYDAAS
ncbi:hypothetical protein ACXO1P_09110 [Lactobacillus delbrueckii subsp. bulgaricus]